MWAKYIPRTPNQCYAFFVLNRAMIRDKSQSVPRGTQAAPSDAQAGFVADFFNSKRSAGRDRVMDLHAVLVELKERTAQVQQTQLQKWKLERTIRRWKILVQDLRSKGRPSLAEKKTLNDFIAQSEALTITRATMDRQCRQKVNLINRLASRYRAVWDFDYEPAWHTLEEPTVLMHSGWKPATTLTSAAALREFRVATTLLRLPPETWARIRKCDKCGAWFHSRFENKAKGRFCSELHRREFDRDDPERRKRRSDRALELYHLHKKKNTK
jgi:hypothetical protein